MPVIINGEIVPDNDPRAQSMRRSGQPGPAAGARGPSGPVSASSLFNNGNGVGTTPTRPGPAGLALPEGPDGVFTPLSRALGMEGRELIIPSVFGVPEQRFPQIVALVAAALALLMGWRFGLGFMALYLIIKSNQAAQQQQQQQQQPPHA